MRASTSWLWMLTVLPLATVMLLSKPDHGYGGAQAVAAEGRGTGFSDLQLDQFGIASSRTNFLPSPPAGKVTVQLLATAVAAAIPGEFKFYLAAPEASKLGAGGTVPAGQAVPKGPEIENGIVFVEPGKFYTVEVVYENPTDRAVEFLVSAPQIDPLAALPFARARCWCAAIPFLAPPHGAFYRTIQVGVAPDTPPGAKAIVEWPVISLSE
jgi:hypothetical protein